MSAEALPRTTWQEFLDAADRMSRQQRVVVALMLLAMIAEGLDVTGASFVYPAIVAQWGTPLGAITATVTAGVLAMAIGGAAAGPLADRHGRKRTAGTGMVVFGLATAAMALTTSVGPFAILRIVACLGLGATMPVLMTIVADSVPGHRRAQMVALSFCGVAVGTIMGGFLSAAVIPSWGWHALLLFCGLAPLLLMPAIAVLVPEPPSVFVSRGLPVAQARHALERLAPGRDTTKVDFDLHTHEAGTVRRSPVATVFSRGLLLTTTLLGLAFFVGLGVVFLILNYLPLMLAREGFTPAQAGVIASMFGWGGLIGQVLVSYAVKRFDRFLVLVVLWIVGLVGLVSMAVLTLTFTALLTAVLGLGLSLSSASAALNALAALAYPPAARATGMGWASAAGRLGTLASGLLGGLVIAAGWGIGEIFLTMGLPVGGGVVAVLALRSDTRRRNRPDGDAEVSALRIRADHVR